LKELSANVRLSTTAEQHAVRQDDRHDTIILEVVKFVEQEREVRGRLCGQPKVLEAHVLGYRLIRIAPLHTNLINRRVG
jgi:hypothetical protein